MSWTSIVDMLGSEIDGVPNHLELPQATATGAELKAFEDRLDAVVCYWVAICALERRAVAFGDDASAIWIPAPLI